MKFLVTGGAGFIGTQLCKKLRELGDVYSIDNYSTGSKDNHIDEVTYIEGSTYNSTLPIVDIIYHLGEGARVVPSFEKIEGYHKSNITGTFNVLQHCIKTGAKIIYSASSAPLSKNGTRESPYSYMKHYNTGLIERFAEWYDLKYAITYFYNVYGNPNKLPPYSSVVDVFREKHARKESLPVVRPGTQLRSYIHVSDVVGGLISTINTLGNESYHFGTYERYSVMDIVNMFKSEYTFIDERPGDRSKSAEPDLATCSKLKWRPSINLPDWIESIK